MSYYVPIYLCTTMLSCSEKQITGNMGNEKKKKTNCRALRFFSSDKRVRTYKNKTNGQTPYLLVSKADLNM